jgi:regulator of replication initiation timing
MNEQESLRAALQKCYRKRKELLVRLIRATAENTKLRAENARLREGGQP